ncbi:hypothetical protein [Rhodopila sp.]|uniref:hypothetical protein n=1 Tax=Rhodopila sp. TaxID=2480087 RepID=UPI003D1216E3
MLSPATFIGIAKAVGQPAPAAAPGRSARPAAPAQAGPPAGVQPVRILTTPPVAAPMAPLAPPRVGAPAAAASGAVGAPGTTATPPRNLPRGSLLDLSV